MDEIFVLRGYPLITYKLSTAELTKSLEYCHHDLQRDGPGRVLHAVIE